MSEISQMLQDLSTMVKSKDLGKKVFIGLVAHKMVSWDFVDCFIQLIYHLCST